MSFINSLLESGWKEIRESVEYRKGDWILIFDTSSWIEIGTISHSRIFDVPLPDSRHEKWCIKLIEHLCTTQDSLEALRQQSRD